MELVPPYLAAYLWRIRKHSGELGYLEGIFKSDGLKAAVYEKSMLAELEELHLIALTKEEDVVVYDPCTTDVDGVDYAWTGTEKSVSFPRAFVMLARGHWLWTEYLVCGLRWLMTAVLGGIIGTLITIRVTQRFG